MHLEGAEQCGVASSLSFPVFFKTFRADVTSGYLRHTLTGYWHGMAPWMVKTGVEEAGVFHCQRMYISLEASNMHEIIGYLESLT